MKFRFYLWGKNSDWEAICTDLDIAVQGYSSEGTKLLLHEAVSGILNEVETLPLTEQMKFLNRRAPLCLRAYLQAKFYLFWMSRKYQRWLIVR